MSAVLLIVQFLIAIALTAVILMQRSEGGALGIGGGGPGGMMSGRGAANLLTRTTMILGAAFIANSIVLAVLSGVDTTNRSVIDRAGETQEDSDLPFSAFDEIPDESAPAQPGETAAGDTAGEGADEGAPDELPNR